MIAAVSLVATGVSATGISPARASQVELGASQDATLLGGSDATTDRSLADPGIFVGTDGDDNPKRGLIEFNIAGSTIPAGATITAVTLQMTVGQVAGSGGGSGGGTAAAETISLFNESQSWGQPTNFAGEANFPGTGHGAPPDMGDATWNYAFYNTTSWAIAGGDWSTSLTDIADASVTGTLTSFTWSSAAMVTNVQSWLNNPSTNFGWIIKNADETDPVDFRAFWSAQGAAANDNPSIAPELTVTYTAAPPATAYWSGAQSGSAGLVWSTELGSPGSPGTNWSATDGGADLHQIPGGGVTNVIFGATGNSAGALSTTLGADFSINSLTFASTRTNSVIIGGANTLTLFSGGITVQSGSGAHTINATGNTMAGTPGIVLGASQTWTNNSSNTLTVQSTIGDAGAGHSLTIAGSGVIQLAGANTYTGGTTVNSGTLVADVNNAIPTNTSLSINANGVVQLASATGLTILSSLTITANGTLDITNNHVIIKYAAGTQTTVDAEIRGYLINGYNHGAWNGTGGIDSSTAALSANNASYSVGYADGADGVVTGLSSGQLEVKYALLGDTDLDGTVTGSDFTNLVSNLGKSGRTWDQGDFEYTGTVTGSDFTDLVANLGKTASGADITLPASVYAAVDAFAAANGFTADVPEPASMGLALISGIGALSLRRRATSRGLFRPRVRGDFGALS